MKKYILLLLIIGWGQDVWAQTIDGDEALQTVLEVLSNPQKEINNIELLQKGAWEALSYIEEKTEQKYEVDDLKEAVGDYYRFYETEVLIKLINPQDYNTYHTSFSVPYIVEKGHVVLAQGKDMWEILYLDKNYLALKMDNLRIFFTHTALQE